MEFLFLAGLGAFIAAGLASLFSEHKQITRALRLTKQTSVADFPRKGPGKIVGTLSYVEEPILAPLTGRPCAYYQVVVQECSINAGIVYWIDLVREASGVVFRVEDDTGTAVVDPSDAMVAITPESLSDSVELNPPTATQQAFFERHGQIGGGLGNRQLRYSEAVLDAEKYVAILGHGMRVPDPEGASAQRGYREGPPICLRLVASRSHALFISDDLNRLGSI